MDTAPAFDTINRSKISKALVGTHFLDSLRSGGHQHQHPTLPPGLLDDFPDDLENGSNNAHAVAPAVHEEPTIITKVKALPQSAANSVIDFVSNPVLIILFVGSLIYNEKKLRRAYHRFRTEGSLKDIYPFLTLDPSTADESSDEKDAAISSSSSTAPLSQLEDQKVEEISTAKPDSTAGDEDKDKDRDRDSSESSEPVQKSDDKAIDAAAQVDVATDSQAHDSNGAAPEKKKKAHRGRRGGVKHKKNRPEGQTSRDDDGGLSTVDEAVSNAKKLGDRPSLEPDFRMIYNDMQAVTGSIISIGNIEVDTDVELGMGSNGTVVFAGRFDGRDVAVKRMTIQFYDIATRETRLLRESDDHPNGEYNFWDKTR